MSQSRVIGFALIIMSLLIILFTVPGEKGLISSYHLHHQLLALKERNASLQQENYTLTQKALLLKKDKGYLEHIIMKEMNLVKPRDTVIIFKEKKR